MTTLAHLIRGALLQLSLVLLLFSVNAQAAIENAGILDNALISYSTAANTWASTITAHASWLFWTLGLISMVSTRHRNARRNQVLPIIGYLFFI